MSSCRKPAHQLTANWSCFESMCQPLAGLLCQLVMSKTYQYIAKLTNIVLRLLRVLVPPPLICHRLLARAIQLSILKLRRLRRRRRRGDPGYYRKVRGVSKGLRIGPCDQGSASDEESTTAPPSDVTTPPATTTPTTTMPTTTTVPGRKSL